MTSKLSKKIISSSTARAGQLLFLTLARQNDPKRPPLHTDFLDKFPVYVRMEPRGDRPSWTVLFYRDPSGPAFMQDLTSILVLVDVAEVVGGQVMNRKFREYVPFITATRSSSRLIRPRRVKIMAYITSRWDGSGGRFAT